MFFSTLFSDPILGKGFGFNTNILDTNIINLTVVIFIVVSFVGDALKALLENRKKTIVNNLREADQRAVEAEQKLNRARKQLELAKTKAIEIRQQSFQTIEQEKLQLFQQTKKEITRFEELKTEIISLQQQKIVANLSQQVLSLALFKVRRKLKNSLDFSFHTSIINFNIVLLTNYRQN
jgi:F-type H+-transporting ATPase subunit b